MLLQSDLPLNENVMHRRPTHIPMPVSAVLFGLLAFVSIAFADTNAKISAAVRARASDGAVDVILVLSQQADLASVRNLAGKEAKGQAVFDALRAAQSATQPAVIERLEALAVSHRTFWIANMIGARASLSELEDVATLEEIARVVLDAPLSADEAVRTAVSEGTDRSSAIEWNVAQVGAPAVWAEGVTGQGTVIGIIDTGVDWDHPALIEQYRGWDGVTATHDYNWHDAIHDHAGPCPADSPEPCDEHGHGTAVLGSALGDDDGANQIGVAPGAEWIGCRCYEPSLRSHVTYVSECFQFMLAPTDLSGQNPDPSKAPDVINNSWVCEPAEGCTDVDILKTIVETLRTAGIVVEAGAGNNGSSCSSVFYPPALYDASFSIGATDAADNIASFSSRGPVTIDGSGRLKPDVSAPGVSVRTSVTGGGYSGGWSGTSIAGPHVSGAVALIISANPRLRGAVDVIETIIEQTAVPRTATQDCGGPGGLVPNNVYGYGRLDALAAYERAVTTVTVPTMTDGPAVVIHARHAPDPIRTSVTITFELARDGAVSVRVYDIAGRGVRLLLRSDRVSVGTHAVDWDGRDETGRLVPSGTYFYRIDADGGRYTRRITLVR